MFFPKRLDLNIHARGQIEFGKRVDGLRSRLKNIHQTLMGSNLKLLARLLIAVRRTQHAIPVPERRQWDGSRHLRPGPLGGGNNFRRRLVQDPVVVRFQPDSNLLMEHYPSSTSSLRLRFRRPRYGRLRGWRSATLFPWRWA